MAQIEPRIHSTGSRFKEAVGESSDRGFRWGILGAVVGTLAVPALAVTGVAAAIAVLPFTGVTTLAGGFSALGLSGALLIGIPSAIVAAPFTAGSTALGAAIGSMFGVTEGAKSANRRTGKEQDAARYMQAYQATKMQLQQNAMANMAAVASQPIMPAPAMEAPTNPYMQAASNQIDASTIAHQQTIDGPALAQGKG